MFESDLEFWNHRNPQIYILKLENTTTLRDLRRRFSGPVRISNCIPRILFALCLRLLSKQRRAGTFATFSAGALGRLESSAKGSEEAARPGVTVHFAISATLWLTSFMAYERTFGRKQLGLRDPKSI